MKSVYFIFILEISSVIRNALTLEETDEKDSCPTIVSKKRWGGRAATALNYQILPVKYVIIHHTVTDTCNTKIECANIVENIQTFHMDTLQWDDIGYNFLVGNDGRIYEGVGWHIEGAHTYGYNKKGLGIAFIGDFSEKLPTAAAMDAVKALLNCGVQMGELDRNYKLMGGRQLIASASPGLELYGEIQEWNNWVAAP